MMLQCFWLATSNESRSYSVCVSVPSVHKQQCTCVQIISYPFIFLCMCMKESGMLIYRRVMKMNLKQNPERIREKERARLVINACIGVLLQKKHILDKAVQAKLHLLSISLGNQISKSWWNASVSSINHGYYVLCFKWDPMPWGVILLQISQMLLNHYERALSHNRNFHIFPLRPVYSCW